MLKEHYGFINSSLTVLFHVVVLFLAPFFARLFPESLGAIPLIAMIFLPILLFWFFFLARNHTDTSFLLLVIPSFAIICAFFAVLAAINGSSFQESLPIITPATTPLVSVPLLNLFFVSYTGSAPILASVVMYYAALNYIVSSLIAVTFEVLYENIIQKKLPKKLNRKLTKFDLTIDQVTFTFLDKDLLMRQNIGAVLTTVILILFTILYTIVLLAF